MKYILISILIVNVLIGIEVIESEYLYRGINCELLYMQGRVDAAKSIDEIKKYTNDNKKIKQRTKEAMNVMFDKVKELQLYWAKIENTQQCVSLELTFLERLYHRFK